MESKTASFFFRTHKVEKKGISITQGILFNEHIAYDDI